MSQILDGDDLKLELSALIAQTMISISKLTKETHEENQRLMNELKNSSPKS